MRKWSVYTCIIWETYHQDELYILIEGRWYHVGTDYAETVRRFVNDIESSDVELISAREGQPEKKYNEKAADGSDRLLNMDREYFSFGTARTKIEFCDLLSKRGKFIHVKRGVGSSTLSHLFSQGTVSAEAFAYEQASRRALRNHVGADSDFNVFPDKPPTCSDYEVCYAIISPKSISDWGATLPFFSNVNLRQRTRRLRRMGFNVTLKHIPVVATYEDDE